MEDWHPFGVMYEGGVNKNLKGKKSWLKEALRRPRGCLKDLRRTGGGLEEAFRKP